VKYYITLTVEAQTIQGALDHIYPIIDESSEGIPKAFSEISIQEAAE